MQGAKGMLQRWRTRRIATKVAVAARKRFNVGIACTAGQAVTLATEFGAKPQDLPYLAAALADAETFAKREWPEGTPPYEELRKLVAEAWEMDELDLRVDRLQPASESRWNPLTEGDG